MDAEPNCDAGASGERKAALLFISPPPVCDSGSVPRMGAVPFSPRSGMSESSNEEKKTKKTSRRFIGRIETVSVCISQTCAVR